MTWVVSDPNSFAPSLFAVPENTKASSEGFIKCDFCVWSKASMKGSTDKAMGDSGCSAAELRHILRAGEVERCSTELS